MAQIFNNVLGHFESIRFKQKLMWLRFGQLLEKIGLLFYSNIWSTTTIPVIMIRKYPFSMDPNSVQTNYVETFVKFSAILRIYSIKYSLQELNLSQNLEPMS